MSATTPEPSSPKRRRQIDRVTAACDLCKTRKVKCDGALPCSYCTRKGRANACHFSGPRTRPTLRQPLSSATDTPARSHSQGPRRDVEQEQITSAPERPKRRSNPSSHRTHVNADADVDTSLSPTMSRDDPHEDTAVPLEARLLRDAQGKVIFIGDCAPLSFLQTVRHLIAREIDTDGLPATASRDSFLEIARPQPGGRAEAVSAIQPNQVNTLVDAYFTATSGLVDLFDKNQIVHEIRGLAERRHAHQDAIRNALYYLILAIGAQDADESRAEGWFGSSRHTFESNLCNSMNVTSVQGFALVAIYMLRACQPNGAYLYFSLAGRTAYAIGLHRTEVNASYGALVHSQSILRAERFDEAMNDCSRWLTESRDRIWKSLRVVDMLISSILGRPPSTSDVDCTVEYSTPSYSADTTHLLDASVQIFMIMERVVVEVYSRKRISIRIASYVSRQLKTWASNWLVSFTAITSAEAGAYEADLVVGTSSALCSYFYAIMLLTRPFLIYDLYEYLGASMRTSTPVENNERKKFADAAVDAAATFVDVLQAVIRKEVMPSRMPLIVSWLFTASLVLAVSVLGRSGLTSIAHGNSAIWCLDHFAKVDPHARQYSEIAQTLLETTTQYVKKREQNLHSQRKQASSQLFGLLPDVHSPSNDHRQRMHDGSARTTQLTAQQLESTDAASDWTFYDADFFALPWINENDVGLQDFLQPGRQTLQGSLADIPLFPMYDQHVPGQAAQESALD